MAHHDAAGELSVRAGRSLLRAERDYPRRRVVRQVRQPRIAQRLVDVRLDSCDHRDIGLAGEDLHDADDVWRGFVLAEDHLGQPCVRGYRLSNVW